MTRLVVSLDVPTAAEALRAARALSVTGAGVRLGPRLLNRVGPAVVATMYPDLDVMVDARIGGSSGEVAAGARALAALGARWITVEGGIGPEAVAAAADAVAEYGADLVATTVPPEAPDPPGGRGRVVSSLAQSLAATGVAAVLGVAQDVGVVVQVAPAIPVIVFGAVSTAEVTDVLERGALAAVIMDGIARAVDPAAAVAPYIEAAQAA